MDQVEERLDEWAPELESDRPVSGEVISAPGGWRFAACDCAYATSMVSRWGQESDRPKGGRHQWALDRGVRLAAATRLGCLSEAGLKSALEHLEKCLAHWCQVVGEPRALHHKEIQGATWSAWQWGADKVGKMTDTQARAELGGHTHNGKYLFGIRPVGVRPPPMSMPTRTSRGHR
jgi:hypothetical protein